MTRGDAAHAAASSSRADGEPELDVVPRQRHECLLERRLLRRQLVERDASRRGGVADLRRGQSRAPRAAPRSTTVTVTPGPSRRSRSSVGLRRAHVHDLLRGACARTRRRSCRRSAGRGRSRSADRRSAPSRSSGARRRTPSGPRPPAPLSRLRIQWMPSGSRPLTGSSRISVSGSPSSALRDPEPLAHAERELAGALVRHLAQTDEIDQLVDAASRDAVRLGQREQMVVRRTAACGRSAPRAARRPRAAARRGRGSACRSPSRRRRSARRGRGSVASSSTCPTRSGRGSR